jgi:hypothetical protein
VKLSLLGFSGSTGSHGLKQVLIGLRDPQNIAGQRGYWAQVFDSKGPTGSAVLIDTPSDIAGACSMAGLTSSATSRNYRFSAVYEEGIQLNVPPTSSESVGLILLNMNFTFP